MEPDVAPDGAAPGSSSFPGGLLHVLVYIDESGHPRPTDSNTRPVLLAACINERDAGQLTRALYSMKASYLAPLSLNRGEQEGHAIEFLNRRSLLKSAEKRTYAEAFFDFIRDSGLMIFAVVMERPTQELYQAETFLQPHFRWLLERIDRFMEREHPRHFALPIFDGQDPRSNEKLSRCFTNFMARSKPGRAMQRIVPSPLFVDSTLTPGIQIADMCAYVLRIAHERNLFQDKSVSDPYLATIKRFATVVREKSVNYSKDDGGTWYGIATFGASRFVYEAPLEQTDEQIDEEMLVLQS
jgi:hypothetical protein